nr:unnamed protein product [Digitaria exilis]
MRAAPALRHPPGMSDTTPAAAALNHWNRLIQLAAASGSYADCLHLYSASLLAAGLRGNASTFPSLAKSCAALRLPGLGRAIHARALLAGAAVSSDAFVRTSLVDMYAKCGRLPDARRLFDETPLSSRTLVAWNCMVSAYGRSSQVEEAVAVFNAMRRGEVRPSGSTLVGLLSGNIGVCLYGYSVKSGLDADVLVSNSVLTMLVRGNQLEAARLLFDHYTTRRHSRASPRLPSPPLPSPRPLLLSPHLRDGPTPPPAAEFLDGLTLTPASLRATAPAPDAQQAAPCPPDPNPDLSPTGSHPYALHCSCKELIEHKLDLNETVKPKKQRLHQFATERRVAIKKELAKLLAADFIKETRNPDDLIADLTETFDNLRKWRWKLNPAKCIFGVPSGKLLGFIFSERSIEPEHWIMYFDGSIQLEGGGAGSLIHEPTDKLKELMA